MKNIELKVKVNEFEEIEKSLKIMKAKFNGILYQKIFIIIAQRAD